MTKSSVFFFCTALIALTNHAYSAVRDTSEVTSRVSIGFVAGATFNTFRSSSPIGVEPGDCKCPDYELQTGEGRVLGIDLGIPLSSSEAWPWSLDVRTQYVTSQAVLYREGDSLPGFDENGEIVYSIYEWRGSIGLSTIEVAPAILLGIGKTPLSVSLGASIGYIMESELLRTLHMIEPPNAVFDPSFCPECEYFDEGRSLVLSRGAIDGIVKWTATAFAGVEYRLVNEDAEVVSSLRYRYGLTDVSTTYGLRVNAIEFSIAMRVFL